MDHARVQGGGYGTAGMNFLLLVPIMHVWNYERMNLLIITAQEIDTLSTLQLTQGVVS
jgi:hypothetical protein